MVIIACGNNDHSIESDVVRNSIDSILKENVHRGPSKRKIEVFWMDEYGHEGRRKQWIYMDSIEKYCGKSTLVGLYKHHESNIIRMVAFNLLLKKAPKDAVRLAIDDMDDTDSLLCGRCDEQLIERCSSIRTRLIQQWPKKFTISIEDSLTIDSAVMKSKNKNSNWYYLLNLKHKKK